MSLATPPPNPVRRVEAAEFARLNLRAHSFLYDVPLHDVWAVDLPGGGGDRTIDDVRTFFSPERIVSINPVVRALFELRGWLGRTFGWDDGDPEDWTESFSARLTKADRDASRVEPGTPEGPFRSLYVFDDEAASEVVNATVHAFTVLAMAPRADGYLLYWAIYVRPTGRYTGLYMAVIDPFRRYLIYPTILRHIHNTWERRFNG